MGQKIWLSMHPRNFASENIPGASLLALAESIYLSEFENVATRLSPSAGSSLTPGQCGLQKLRGLNLAAILVGTAG